MKKRVHKKVCVFENPIGIGMLDRSPIHTYILSNGVIWIFHNGKLFVCHWNDKAQDFKKLELFDMEIESKKKILCVEMVMSVTRDQDESSVHRGTVFSVHISDIVFIYEITKLTASENVIGLRSKNSNTILLNVEDTTLQKYIILPNDVVVGFAENDPNIYVCVWGWNRSSQQKDDDQTKLRVVKADPKSVTCVCEITEYLEIDKIRTLFATGGSDNVIRIWDSERLKVIAELSGNHGHTSAITSLFSRNEFLISCSNSDQSIRIWNLRQFIGKVANKSSSPIVISNSHTKTLQNVVVCNSGRLLCINNDKFAFIKPKSKGLKKSLARLRFCEYKNGKYQRLISLWVTEFEKLLASMHELPTDQLLTKKAETHLLLMFRKFIKEYVTFSQLEWEFIRDNFLTTLHNSENTKEFFKRDEFRIKSICNGDHFYSKLQTNYNQLFKQRNLVKKLFSSSKEKNIKLFSEKVSELFLGKSEEISGKIHGVLDKTPVNLRGMVIKNRLWNHFEKCHEVHYGNCLPYSHMLLNSFFQQLLTIFLEKFHKVMNRDEVIIDKCAKIFDGFDYENQLCQENVLAKGTLGTIYKAEIAGDYHAVKCLDSTFPVEKLINEFKHNMSIIHPNILKCKSLDMDKRRLIYEYCERGTLYDLRRNKDSRLSDVQEKVRILQKVCTGMTALHSMQICHTYVKSIIN